ncbi:hypothetical protein EVJ32_08200 [Exiguobacterium sp. SH5S4]|uniref:hypothetical protein n=1 Tax=Exiguobacterium sp. SH5S4 TaxID=2510961 RepID=UPI0010391DC1|nr:hypothetical protein [Exiguobacterium sp. SH5S4]TCI25844.1 hypothetical protein EVJ32_08200 [Exiguobacterium sp. SH5S4]
MKSSKLALALAGLLAVSGTGVYAATNETTTTETTESTEASTQCERGERGERGMFGDRAAGQAALLEALGLSEAEVEAAREEGQSLPELAEEKGITVDAFIDAIIASHEVKLDAAVENGNLTQAEADAILAEHEERFADVTSYENLDDMRGFGGKGRHGHGAHNGFGGQDGDADDAPATEEDSTVENQSTSSL